MAEITMPQLGETVTEGTITRWAKQVGDAVAEDEVLFEVSTDKVDSEVPSPVAGVVAEILVPEGETVDVGTRLAVISDGAAGTTAPARTEPEPVPEPAAADTAPAAVSSVPAADLAEAPSNGSGAVAPPGTGEPAPEPATPSPVQQEQREAAESPVAGEEAGRVLSPVVRRLIAEHNLDPSEIRGSGAGGRITRGDVLELIDRRNGGSGAKAPAPSAAPAAATPAARTAPAAAGPAPAGGGSAPVQAFGPSQAGERDEVVPFTNIRRRTAEHMIRSKHTSAHTMVATEVDYYAVEKARSAAKEQFRQTEGFGLTYLPFITRAVVDAIAQFPHVNSSVGEDALIVHHDVNLGIAVDLDFEGLLVPVIHDADGKRLRALARDISGLAAKARARRLTMDDISGGTFTITNAGPFGTLITVPVINQPQVAILSTDGVKKRPVVVELPDGTDSIAIHPVGNLVMSWDHRAFDGAYAAAFVRAIKDILETRDWASEL